MPRHITLASLPAGWTQATSGDVTAIRIQNTGSFAIQIQRGSAATPSSLDGAITMAPGQILPADMVLAALWPGASGSRVWIFASIAQGGVSISHA